MEKILVSAGIRLIGLWWIFYDAGSHLYYVIVKHSGLLTTSTVPVAYNEQTAIFDVLFGIALVLLAPVITLMVFGTGKPVAGPADEGR